MHDSSLNESLANYHDGGFHPVHLGDTLASYTVIDKLGHGATSTVWLAKRNKFDDECIGIAICSASDSTEVKHGPLKQWLKLRDADPRHSGRPHVLVPEEHFEIEGPNGRHLGLIFPVQGQSVSAGTKRGEPDCRPLHLPLARQVIRDVILGLSYCHSLGLVHGDLHPANILLGLPPETSRSTRAMFGLAGAPRIAAVTRPDGATLDARAPRYVVESILAREFDPGIFTGLATIADWGSCFSVRDPPQRTADLGPYLVPEFNSHTKISEAVDIWMLGCLIFEILTGKDLFGVKDDAAPKVLNAMMNLLGPPPEYMMENWLSFVENDAELDVPDGPAQSLRDMVQRAVRASHDDMALSDDELNHIITLLESMLVYEPAQRPVVDEIRGNPTLVDFLY